MQPIEFFLMVMEVVVVGVFVPKVAADVFWMMSSEEVLMVMPTVTVFVVVAVAVAAVNEETKTVLEAL